VKVLPKLAPLVGSRMKLHSRREAALPSTLLEGTWMDHRSISPLALVQGGSALITGETTCARQAAHKRINANGLEMAQPRWRKRSATSARANVHSNKGGSIFRSNCWSAAVAESPKEGENVRIFMVSP
jgi:hypothetical protein